MADELLRQSYKKASELREMLPDIVGHVDLDGEVATALRDNLKILMNAIDDEDLKNQQGD